MYEFKITSVNKSSYAPESGQAYKISVIPAVLNTDKIVELFGRPEQIAVDPLLVDQADLNPFWYLDFTYEETDSDGYKTELDGQAVLTRTPHANGTFVWEICCPDNDLVMMVGEFIVAMTNEAPELKQQAAE